MHSDHAAQPYGPVSKSHKPAPRRGQVLFINADAEFHAGRAQNYLRPEHVEKIVSTFDRYEDVPAYARAVRMEVGPGLSATFASYDDLLAMKRAAGRAQDLDDVERLEALGERGDAI